MCVDQCQLDASLETAYSGEVACTVGDVVSVLWSNTHFFLDCRYVDFSEPKGISRQKVCMSR